MSATDLLYYAADEAPAPPAPTIRLGPAIIGARGGPIDVADPDAEPSADILAEIFRHPDYRTPVATLEAVEDPVDGAIGKHWQDRYNEAGGGGLTAPWRSTLLDVIEPDDLCRFSYKGQAAMMVVLNDEDRHTIAATESSQTVDFTGPGHLALMSEAVVYPSRGIFTSPVERDRIFNWTSPQYNDDSWIPATAISAQGSPTTYWTGLPPNWPDITAQWIWASRQDPGFPDLDEWSPAGSCYFRHDFEVPAGVSRICLFLTMDAAGELYFDTQLLLSTDNGAADPTDLRTMFLDVTPGTTYTLAAHCANDVDPEGDMVHNPAGVLVAVYAADSTGNLADLITHSDNSWVMVEYADPPGMTPGEVLRIVFTEAQFRGELEGWTWTFDDDVDSNGNPWPSTQDIGTKVGNDYLTFIGELTAAPWIDIRAQPGGLVIDAYNTGTMGSTVPLASFHPPTDADDPLSGNITELRHRRRAKTATRLLIGSRFPWRHIDVTPGGERVKTATLGLGAVPSPAEADRIATGQLATYANVRSAITVGIEPVDATDSPYLTFRIGDVVEVPDHELEPVNVAVRSVTVTEDTQGKVTFALEVNDVLIEAAERYAATLKKMANGTLMGDAPAGKVATPVNALPATPATCCAPAPPPACS